VFEHGNCHNFLFYVVADEQVPGRRALLETIRKLDAPADELYRWRRRALRTVIEYTGRLLHPAMPEPLDTFDLPDGEPALVYNLIGQDRSSLLLRDKLQIYGFIDTNERDEDSGWRLIDQIARYMKQLAVFTQELWDQGFVHACLHPDHLYILRDQVLRVTGCSAVCKRDGGVIRSTEAGLRNLRVGYQSIEHHQHVANNRIEPLDAQRVRWTSYAALVLELLWGRDVGEYCLQRGHTSVMLTRDTRDALWDDCKSLMHTIEKGQGVLHRALLNLFTLLEKMLNWSMELPADLYPTLLELWDELDNSEFNRQLWIQREEFARRKQTPRHWSHRRPGDEPEVLVTSYEEGCEVQTREGRNLDVNRYRARDLRHPAKGRGEGYLQTVFSSLLFLPGDQVPAIYKHFDPEAHRPVLFPSDWAGYRTQVQLGETMRALSLGRRTRATVDTHRSDPWARVEIDGALLAFPIKPRTEEEKFIIYPRAGRFFQAEFRGDGVLPIGNVPDIDVLAGQSVTVPVRHIHHDLAFFDLPLGPDHLVTIVLPRARWRTDQMFPGKEVPLRIQGFDRGTVLLDWDQASDADLASVGEVYQGRFLRLSGHRVAVVGFGEGLRLQGFLHEERMPWGLPYRSWADGDAVSVRVDKVLKTRQGARYDLGYVGPSPARRVEEVFRPRMVCQGVIEAHSDRGVFVLLAEGSGPNRIEAVGLIRPSQMLRQERQSPEVYYPKHQPLRVAVREVHPEQREILLEPEA
jgi:hypothetical protein